jgi:hypothetical protein
MIKHDIGNCRCLENVGIICMEKKIFKFLFPTCPYSRTSNISARTV